MNARKLSPEKRERYLSAALKLFVENGVNGTSTNAIAKEAGTAAGTLFLYFPTKQDLVDELILEVYRKHTQYIDFGQIDSISAKEFFAMIWDGLINWFRENLEAYQYVQQVRETGVISESVLEESNQYLAYFFQVIQKGLAENAIKSYPLELIGEILYRDIVAVMNLIKLDSDPEKQDAYIQSGFQIFWDGIKR